MKNNAKLKILVTLIVAGLSLSSCGSITGILKETTQISESSQTQSQPQPVTTEPTNKYNVSQASVEGLSNDWTSLQFAYNGEINDWIGKTPNDMSDEWTIVVNEENKTLKAGTEQYYQVMPTQKQTDGTDPFFNVLLQNPTMQEITPLEAKILSVNFQSSSFSPSTVSESNEAPQAIKAAMIAGGLTAYDPEARVIELYGEPTERVADEYFQQRYSLVYRKDDKSLNVSIFYEHVDSYTIAQVSTPEYLVKARESVANDAQTTMDENSYLNVAGYKLYLNNKYQDFAAALSPYEVVMQSSSERDLEKMIAPQSELSTVVRIPGYDKSSVYLRLYNPTDTELVATDADLIGIKVVHSSLFGSYDAPYFLPVATPYGVKNGTDFKAELAKLPADAVENVLAEDGGGYATLVANGYRLLLLAIPGENWDHDINEILFTVDK